MKKTSLILVYGGRSGEHEVSVRSATAIAAGFDHRKYDVVPVRIAKSGAWSVDPSILPKARRAVVKKGRRFFVPDPTVRNLLDEAGKKAERIDVVFPIVHGTFGEDGSLQGLLEMAEVPYVGSCVLGSAVGMDKIVAKKLLREAGLPVAASVDFTDDDWRKNKKALVDRIAKELGFPCFVKPANMGSSVGVGKAHHRKALVECIEEALRYDLLVLVERAIPKAREIECAVLGGAEPTASVLGEIVPSNEFYDYDAKYCSDASKEKIPADLTHATAARITDLALRAFKALRAYGLARVDCLVSTETREIVVNEINTLPGFTAISLYPKMQAASGVPYPELLDRLVALARERRTAQDGLSRAYQPKC